MNFLYINHLKIQQKVKNKRMNSATLGHFKLKKPHVPAIKQCFIHNLAFKCTI